MSKRRPHEQVFTMTRFFDKFCFARVDAGKNVWFFFKFLLEMSPCWKGGMRTFRLVKQKWAIFPVHTSKWNLPRKTYQGEHLLVLTTLYSQNGLIKYITAI